MQRQLRRNLAADLDRCRIGHNRRIHADALQFTHRVCHTVQIVVIHIGVDGDVDFFAVAVDIIRGALQRVIVKVARIGAQPEALAAHIHRIRAKADGRNELALAANGGEIPVDSSFFSSRTKRTPQRPF